MILGGKQYLFRWQRWLICAISLFTLTSCVSMMNGVTNIVSDRGDVLSLKVDTYPPNRRVYPTESVTFKIQPKPSSLAIKSLTVRFDKNLRPVNIPLNCVDSNGIRCEPIVVQHRYTKWGVYKPEMSYRVRDKETSEMTEKTISTAQLGGEIMVSPREQIIIQPLYHSDTLSDDRILRKVLEDRVLKAVITKVSNIRASMGLDNIKTAIGVLTKSTTNTAAQPLDYVSIAQASEMYLTTEGSKKNIYVQERNSEALKQISKESLKEWVDVEKGITKDDYQKQLQYSLQPKKSNDPYDYGLKIEGLDDVALVSGEENQAGQDETNKNRIENYDDPSAIINGQDFSLEKELEKIISSKKTRKTRPLLISEFDTAHIVILLEPKIWYVSRENNNPYYNSEYSAELDKRISKIDLLVRINDRSATTLWMERFEVEQHDFVLSNFASQSSVKPPLSIDEQFEELLKLPKAVQPQNTGAPTEQNQENKKAGLINKVFNYIN